MRVAQKHLKDNEKYVRKRNESEDMEQLQVLEFKLEKYNERPEKVEEIKKMKQKLRRKHIKRKNVITNIYDDDTVALNMKAKFTLLNKMACDDHDLDQYYDDDELTDS